MLRRLPSMDSPRFSSDRTTSMRPSGHTDMMLSVNGFHVNTMDDRWMLNIVWWKPCWRKIITDIEVAKNNPSWSFVFAVVLGIQNIHVRLLYRRRGVVGLNRRKTEQNTGSSEEFHLFLRSHSVRGRIKQVGGILLHEVLQLRDQALPLSRFLLYEVMSDHGPHPRPSAAS